MSKLKDIKRQGPTAESTDSTPKLKKNLFLELEDCLEMGGPELCAVS